MLPGDRLVCAFVEPQPGGAEFKVWPLHAPDAGLLHFEMEHIWFCMPGGYWLDPKQYDPALLAKYQQDLGRMEVDVGESRDERRSQTRPAARDHVGARFGIAAEGGELPDHRDPSVERSIGNAYLEKGSRSEGGAVEASDGEGVAGADGRRERRGAAN